MSRKYIDLLRSALAAEKPKTGNYQGIGRFQCGTQILTTSLRLFRFKRIAVSGLENPIRMDPLRLRRVRYPSEPHLNAIAVPRTGDHPRSFDWHSDSSSKIRKLGEPGASRRKGMHKHCAPLVPKPLCLVDAHRLRETNSRRKKFGARRPSKLSGDRAVAETRELHAYALETRGRVLTIFSDSALVRSFPCNAKARHLRVF